MVIATDSSRRILALVDFHHRLIVESLTLYGAWETLWDTLREALHCVINLESG
jgi:hypothetical protein